MNHIIQFAKWTEGIEGGFSLSCRIPAPDVPNFDDVFGSASSAIGIAFVAFAISVSMAQLFAKKHDYEIDSNQVEKTDGKRLWQNWIGFFICSKNPSSWVRNRALTDTSDEAAIKTNEETKNVCVAGTSCNGCFKRGWILHVKFCEHCFAVEEFGTGHCRLCDAGTRLSLDDVRKTRRSFFGTFSFVVCSVFCKILFSVTSNHVNTLVCSCAAWWPVSWFLSSSSGWVPSSKHCQTCVPSKLCCEKPEPCCRVDRFHVYGRGETGTKKMKRVKRSNKKYRCFVACSASWRPSS